MSFDLINLHIYSKLHFIQRRCSDKNSDLRNFSYPTTLFLLINAVDFNKFPQISETVIDVTKLVVGKRSGLPKLCIGNKYRGGSRSTGGRVDRRRILSAANGRILIMRIPFLERVRRGAGDRLQMCVCARVYVAALRIGDRSRRPATLIWLMSRYCNDFASDLRLFIYSRQYWPIGAR